ncbi:hypothetical protein [Spiroplasma sp. AdecLV25b]|uniref:hypothetical protein n=1 Tax=Spiroplasma sp. AdecLV25b TaxID=3027162 RepID=UPI0027DF671F|nr:hypothetical protein [Spiroplasma sp. AdecLV25b]
MWESKEIKQLNDKYNELNWKFTELKDEIKTLETEIESLKTTCSLTNGNKSQSFNDLNEDNINSLFTKNFKSSEVNDFDETSLSKQISSSISPNPL